MDGWFTIIWWINGLQSVDGGRMVYNQLVEYEWFSNQLVVDKWFIK